MTGTTQIIQTMYDYLAASPLKGAISGDVYKGERPLNSELEDVTINTLPLTTDQLQRCVVNVNVFVPDIIVANTAGEERKADYARLQALEVIALDTLRQRFGQGYSFYVQQATLFKDNESKTHYLNIRVEFYAPNLN